MILQQQNNDWILLSEKAWLVSENAYIYGNTKVGASIITINKKIYSGCNVEHKFRSHDIHAEVNAISSMIANGEREFEKILIVADRVQFTPCGSCMDWIMQFGIDGALIGFQNKKGGDITVYTKNELMPHYPK